MIYFLDITWQVDGLCFIPVQLLNMVSKKGIGGFIDPTLEVPPMLGISASMLFTKTISGMDVTFNSGH